MNILKCYKFFEYLCNMICVSDSIRVRLQKLSPQSIVGYFTVRMYEFVNVGCYKYIE